MVIKINKILLQLYLLLLFPFLTYADGLNDDFEAYSRISSTINLGPVLTKGIITPDGKNSSSTDKSLITWGLIAGAETSLFITDRIAFEFFMAGSLCPINSSLYSSTTTTGSNNPLMIYIPVGVGLNFHPFPFGGIDPYIGFGGEYDCIFSTSGSVIPENAFTWFGKFGVSLIKSNNSIMSIEVRKSFLNHNIIIKNNNNKEDKYKMTLEPWIITFNFGYNF